MTPSGKCSKPELGELCLPDEPRELDSLAEFIAAGVGTDDKFNETHHVALVKRIELVQQESLRAFHHAESLESLR